MPATSVAQVESARLLVKAIGALMSANHHAGKKEDD